MSLRYQRFILIIISLIFLLLALILMLSNIKNNVVFFFTPSELMESNIKQKNNIRIGGLVKENSLIFNNDTNNINFLITDNKNEIIVNYTGILPDLFKENSGVVAEGRLTSNILNAKKIFAKHDENYMPKSVVEQLKKSKKWSNKY